VILSQGGISGGWMFYVKDGVLTYLYNFVSLESFVVTATQPLTAATHQVRMEFAYDGGGLAKGRTVTLSSTTSRSATDASSGPLRWCSLPTRPPTSA
jgi:hypothetical protein